MKFLTGLVIGFYFGLLSIYIATNQNKPKERAFSGRPVRFYGNTDTMYQKKKKVLTCDKFTYDQIIKNNY